MAHVLEDGYNSAGQNGHISLTDALQNVELLDDCLTVFNDEQPCIDPLPLSISYQANFETNFEDRTAFITGVAKYMEEATVHANINAMLEKGNQYAAMLYTWRSCTRCIPTVKDADQPNKMEIYEKTIQVLEKEVNKLYAFMIFIEQQATKRFAEEVKRLCQKERRKGFVSEAYLLTLGRFMNMFAVMDALKNMKCSVKNDYTHYKRAHEFIRRLGSTQNKITPTLSIEEASDLSMFLANNNVITKTVKQKLIEIEGYEDLLCDIINICVKHFEERLYLIPDEKHMLLKVIGFSLTLMPCTEQSNIYKLSQKNRLNIMKIDKFFRELQVVTLYGDMQIPLGSYVQQMSDYKDNSKHWSCVDLSIDIRTPMEIRAEVKPPQSSNYNISQRLQSIRQEHVKFISELSQKNNQYQVVAAGVNETGETSRNVSEMYVLALRGLRLLSKWTCQVMEIYSWKLAHPTDHKENPSCPKDAEEYERATRYNYTSEEKFAMVELLGMVKGLQVLMHRMDPIFTKAIKTHVYTQIQKFVQHDIRELLRVANKKKKTMLKTIVDAIRSTCADWPQGYNPHSDPINQGEKDSKTGFKPGKLTPKSVGPGSTQLYMVRTMLESLISEKGGERKQIKTLIDQDIIHRLEKFHRDSFFFTHLLNFGETLPECCDLSQLWFREFFLELTMGKRIQFPIEMSMPWILTDHILETREPSMMEFILYPLDLYSDSAQYALTKFKKRFLYDEIEAELNLCFDQFVVKLSEQIFIYYKQCAAFSLLDEKFRQKLPESYRSKIKTPVANKYDSLLKQRHIQLLGRSIDLNRLIRQRIQQQLQSSIEFALDYFDSQQSLCAIYELEHMLEVNKLAHSYLQECLQLDDFNIMVREASFSVANNFGIDRIAEQVFWELTQRVLPHYAYNSSTNRFVPSGNGLLNDAGLADHSNRHGRYVVAPGREDRFGKYALAYGSKGLNECYRYIFKMYTGYIGCPHFRSICRLLGYQGIAFIIKFLFDDVIKTLITTQVTQFAEILLSALPDNIRRPRSDYGAEAVGTFYMHHLKDMYGYPQLKTRVLPKFQELGNAIVFARMIEQSMNIEEIMDLAVANPFQNIIPPPRSNGTQEDLENRIRGLKRRYMHLDYLRTIKNCGTDEQVKLAEEGDRVTKERLCVGLSVFHRVLDKIKSYLKTKDGQVLVFETPDNGIIQTSEVKGFHKLWSAIQFVLIAQQCLVDEHKAPQEQSDEYLFGDSIYWAAGTIMTVLGQQRLFDAFDYSYHIRQVFTKEHLQKTKSPDDNYEVIVDKKYSLANFNAKTYAVQTLMDEIFATLRLSMPDNTGGSQSQRNNANNSSIANIQVFKPPRFTK